MRPATVGVAQREAHMPAQTYYQHVTGFTRGGLGGHDAGVVLPRDNEPLSDSQRLAVAKAAGFKETVFITALLPAAGGCEVAVRFFTSSNEVELSAQTTIACIGLLHDRNLLGGWRRGTLHTRSGKVAFVVRAVRASPPRVFIQQPAPMAGPPSELTQLGELSASLFNSWRSDDPHPLINADWRPRVASVEARCLLVALVGGQF